jgi:hypothetical protein
MNAITKAPKTTEVFRTEDAWLAAALITMGCPPFMADGQGAVLRTVNPDGKELCNFLFVSTDEVKDLARKWLHIENTMAQEPEHPICYLHALMHNRNRCIDAVKQTRRLVFAKKMIGGREVLAFYTEKQ